MNLTPREAAILKGIVAGKMNKQIADGHGRSESTVRTQIGTLMRKVGVSSRTQLAVWAVRKGLA